MTHANGIRGPKYAMTCIDVMDLDDGAPLVPLAFFFGLALMPPGTYGLSYDIYTRATKDDLPFGWNSYPCK